MTTSQTIAFSFSITTPKGIKLSAPFTFSKSVSYAGPTGTELVTSGVYATHRYFTAVGSGTVTKYTWNVYGQYDGQVLRTETFTTITNSSTTTYAQLGSYNASSQMLYIRSAGTSAYKYMAESNWINMVNSSTGFNYIYF